MHTYHSRNLSGYHTNVMHPTVVEKRKMTYDGSGYDDLDSAHDGGGGCIVCAADMQLVNDPMQKPTVVTSVSGHRCSNPSDVDSKHQGLSVSQ